MAVGSWLQMSQGSVDAAIYCVWFITCVCLCTFFLFGPAVLLLGMVCNCFTCQYTEQIRLAEGCCKEEVLPEAVWPGGSSSRQDPEQEPGGTEEQERAETDWFPWGEVWDNRSQLSRDSSPARESETGWSNARGTRGHSKNKIVSLGT